MYSLVRNIRVKFNQNRLAIPAPADKKDIISILDDEQFDILHIQMPYSPFLSQRVLQLASPRTAIVGTFHILPSGRLQRLGSKVLHKWYGQWLERFTAIYAVSPAAQLFAKEVFHINTVVVPNAVNIKRFQMTTAKSVSATKQLVFLGRLVQRKGAKELLEAYHLLIREPGVPLTKLTIAGDGPQRSMLEKKAENLGLMNQVSFSGFIDEAKKPQLLKSADLAIFPALYGESFGIVLIEAMAAGSGVVIGGNNPGYHSVLGERPECMVNPKDSSQFKDTLFRYLTDKKLAADTHTWQQRTVLQYDHEQVGQTILASYRTVIAKRRQKHNNDSHG